MTATDRAAATECVRLIELLLNAKTPHAKELGIIVITRLRQILRDGAGDIATAKELLPWLDLHTELLDDQHTEQP